MCEAPCYVPRLLDFLHCYSWTTIRSVLSRTFLYFKVLSSMKHYSVFVYHFYVALLPRRGPHIASHSVCPTVCLSVPLADVLCLQLHRLTSEHPK